MCVCIGIPARVHSHRLLSFFLSLRKSCNLLLPLHGQWGLEYFCTHTHTDTTTARNWHCLEASHQPVCVSSVIGRVNRHQKKLPTLTLASFTKYLFVRSFGWWPAYYYLMRKKKREKKPWHTFRSFDRPPPDKKNKIVQVEKYKKLPFSNSILMLLSEDFFSAFRVRKKPHIS